MEVLSFLSFPVFFIYIVINLNIRFKILSIENKKHISYFILLSLFVAAIYLYNLYIYNYETSLSFGSDSNYFESIYKDLGEYSISSHLFQFIADENKSFTFFVYYFIYYVSDYYVLNSIILFFCNYLVFFLTIITAISILTQLFGDKELNGLKYYLIYYILSFLIIFSFLRDVYNVFFVIEIAYLLFVSKQPLIYRSIVIAISIYALMNIRNFFAYVILLFIFTQMLMTIINRKYRLYIVLIAIGIIVFLIPQDTMVHELGRLLILQKGDLDIKSINTSQLIDITTFYSGGYSLIELMNYAKDRLTTGFARFVLTPLFSQYVIYYLDAPINNISSYWMGMESRIIQIIHAFMYNFIIFPFFISFLFTFVKDYNKLKDIQKKFYNYFLMIIFAIIFVYSIKFFGARNLKIDFVIHFFLILILSTYNISINKKYIIITLIFMIMINFYYGYIIIGDKLL